MANPIHGSTWLDQWRRINRWRDRVAATRSGERRETLTHDGYADEVFAMLQAVHHLKDWLHYDPALPITKRLVDAWLYDGQRNGPHLRIAADVANGSKHHTLTAKDGKPRQGAEVARNDVVMSIGKSPRYTFWVEGKVDGQLVSIEACDLADACVGEWMDFLVKHGVDAELLSDQYDQDRGIKGYPTVVAEEAGRHDGLRATAAGESE